ncbi:MAG: hypothetical protein HY727_03430 [Candidatus Rokubacteria bacterium]|nr:hypothetical protein [Candidatus Rokubacteria bacterium]
MAMKQAGFTSPHLIGLREHIKFHGAIRAERGDVDNNQVQVVLRGALEKRLINVETIPAGEALYLDLKCAPVRDGTEHVHFASVPKRERDVISTA